MNASQLRAMLWLRWRLTYNQWRRGGQFNAVLTLLMLIVGLGLSMVAGVAGVAGGAIGLSHASPHTTQFVWDGLVVLFLIFWAVGTVMELQRSEIIDLSRLLHLPVSLRGVFLLNYLASHLSFSLAATIPAMLGLTAGLVLGRSVAMLLLLPLVFGFFFMITAWTYCLRNWLAAIMVNNRRRRAIIVGVTMAFVLMAQLPNLFNVWFFRSRQFHPPQNASPAQVHEEWAKRNADEASQRDAVFGAAHRYVPFLWLPLGARTLAEGNPWPALCGALGMVAIGALGLRRAYHGTLRLYQGGENNRLSRPAPTPVAATPAAASATARTSAAGRRLLVERSLPAVPEEAAAVALAGFRSMSRAPEVKMALVTNILIFAIMGASVLLNKPGELPAAARPFVASAAVAVVFLGLMQLMFNHFGFDRAGFRAIVLMPAPRRHVLLGKNLALLPVALVVFVVYLAMAAVLAGLRPWDILAAVLEFGGAFLVLSTLGNLASVLVPYRIASGSLKPTKIKGLTVLLIFVSHMLLPLAMLPVFLPAGLGALGALYGPFTAAAAMLATALVLAALAALLYWQTLGPLGRLLERRERAILLVVTQEVE